MKAPARVTWLVGLLPWLAGCGATEVVVGEAAGVARVVAGVLGESHAISFPDTVVPGRATALPIGSPSGVVGREDGGFLFGDLIRRRIGAVTPDGNLSWPVGRGACGTPGPDGTDPRSLCLVLPLGLALAGDGTLLIADFGGHRVYRFDPAADDVEVVLGTGAQGLAADGAVAVQAPTYRPAAVAVGPDGAIYVAEAGNNRVVRVGGDGLVAAFAGRGTIGDAGDGGPAVDAALRAPAGLAWSGDTLFVADAGNHRIRRVVRDTILAFAGLGAVGFAGDRGPAASALFRDPGMLAVDGTLLFVADRGNFRVRIIRLGPDSIDTFAGTGDGAAGPDLLEAGRTAIAAPAGVAAAGRAVFVSDSGGFVVRRVVR
jgi:sugar lactone lactonase YvrE